MKILFFPFLLLFLPVLFYYLICFKLSINKIATLILGIGLMLFYYYFLIEKTVIISASGIFEKGNKCATGSILFIPLGFLMGFGLIPFIFIMKIVKLYAHKNK